MFILFIPYYCLFILNIQIIITMDGISNGVNLEEDIFKVINTLRYTRRRKPTRSVVFKFVIENFNMDVDEPYFNELITSLITKDKILEKKDSLFVVESDENIQSDEPDEISSQNSRNKINCDCYNIFVK